jgi:hypothetical protein
MGANMIRSALTASLMASLALPSTVQAGGLGDMFKQIVTDSTTSAEQEQTVELDLSALNDSELVKGVKETLTQSVNYAVTLLGKEDGFLNNAKAKIPLPSALKPLEGTLRKLGQQKLTDNLVVSMNRAAEKAIPDAAGVLNKAIENLTVEDAVKILQGPADAATTYFQHTAGEELARKLLPIVKEATDASGVTNTAKAVMEEAGSKLGPFASALSGSLDLDKYVTNQTLEGLFQSIAEEEGRIRQDPVARASDLLKQIFGK